MTCYLDFIFKRYTFSDPLVINIETAATLSRTTISYGQFISWEWNFLRQFFNPDTWRSGLLRWYGSNGILIFVLMHASTPTSLKTNHTLNYDGLEVTFSRLSKSYHLSFGLLLNSTFYKFAGLGLLLHHTHL